MKRRALLYVVSLVSSVACFYGDQMSEDLGPLQHDEVSVRFDVEEEEDDQEDEDENESRLCGLDSLCAAIAHTPGSSAV